MRMRPGRRQSAGLLLKTRSRYLVASRFASRYQCGRGGRHDTTRSTYYSSTVALSYTVYSWRSLIYRMSRNLLLFNKHLMQTIWFHLTASPIP